VASCLKDARKSFQSSIKIQRRKQFQLLKKREYTLHLNLVVSPWNLSNVTHVDRWDHHHFKDKKGLICRLVAGASSLEGTLYHVPRNVLNFQPSFNEEDSQTCGHTELKK